LRSLAICRIPPPPLPTLFPSTTLFRSQEGRKRPDSSGFIQATLSVLLLSIGTSGMCYGYRKTTTSIPARPDPGIRGRAARRHRISPVRNFSEQGVQDAIQSPYL